MASRGIIRNSLIGLTTAFAITVADPAVAQQLLKEPGKEPGGVQMMPALREALATPTGRSAREEMYIVGSSSMSVYTKAIVDRMVTTNGVTPPRLEVTGTREGMRVFCAGRGKAFPDVVAASRRMTKSEFNACVENDIIDIIELPVALDAIIVVTDQYSPVNSLTPKHLYLALAAEVPRQFVMTANVSKKIAQEAAELVGEDFIDNPFTRWSEIDPTLADTPISVYGPAVGSGTRDFINSHVLEAGCRSFKAIRDIFGAADRVRQCTTLREAPYFNSLEPPFEQKVISNVVGNFGALGFVTLDTYEQERERVEHLPINNRMATVDTIASGTYPLRRTVYYYFKRAHMRDQDGVGVVSGLRQFMSDLMREEIIGPGGLFDEIGSVPIAEEDRNRARRDAGTLRRMER